MSVKSAFDACGIHKPVPPAGSLLAANLKTMLDIIRERYDGVPCVHDLLLYLYDRREAEPPSAASGGFRLVTVDYGGCTRGHYVAMRP